MAGAAQGPKPRLASAIASGTRVTLPGTRPAQASRGVDQGAVSASMPLKGITLVFNRTAAQQADLDTLLTAQQDPSSPQFHQWLTPDQFAARFGVADSDIAKVQSWLQGQGFAVDNVARSRDQITFDGTAGQVATAFGTELHRYAMSDRVHYAPATDLSVPATLAPLVTTVLHLADFHAHAHKVLTRAQPTPALTSSQTGNHFLTPSDLATMYDMKSTYSAGFNGAGQAIAIVGQTYIDTSAITAFQSGAGLPSNLPTLVLVPSTGVSGVNAISDGDEGESQLDVEYASGMAPGAKIYLVYTGDQTNHDIFDSLTYAVDANLAPIISGSYGLCETDLQISGETQFTQAYAQLTQQASAQGQTVIFSAGDQGSTDCYGDTTGTTAQQEALAVDFPASTPYVTAMGGTQMQSGTYSSTNTQYWQTATGSDVVSSLLSYVPEAVWNEDSSAEGISAGGGGTSVLFGRPTWQTGVPGIPSGSNRLVPDISLQASVDSPGYLYCTTDASDLAVESETASCTNGLRSPQGTFTLAGGTSFSAPAFAGMLAVLNQAKNSVGQGNINPILYSLASNATTYASAFHDVTTGTNACTAGVTFCSTVGTSAYAATAGFDEATGLGSIDFAKLVAAWPSSTTATAAQVGSTTTLTAATLTPASAAPDLVTITVAPASGSTVTPTGTVTLTVDGVAVSTPLTLSGGTATYTYPGTTVGGTHALVAVYSGDAATLPSRGSLTLTLAGSATPSGSFTLSAQSISVGYNSIANGSLSVVAGTGYTGTVAFTLIYPSTAPTLCSETTSSKEGNASNFTLSGGGTATGTLTLGEGTACSTTALGTVVLGSGQKVALRGSSPGAPSQRWPEGIAFAGLLCGGLAFRKGRRLPALLSMVVLAGLGLGLSGCGSSSVAGSTTTTTTTQTVTATLTGVDTVNPSITASTTVSVTIHP